MDPLIETAPAKVNLTLKVLGRRGDGFHELSSLITFAKFGDILQLIPDGDLSFSVSGAFRGKLGAGNLVVRAARLLSEHCGALKTGAMTLEKNLPVAAGLGGGSADAAAALRLIGRANPGVVTERMMAEVACQLGSDVLACLTSHATVMRGRGLDLSPLEGLPALDAVLVNPGVHLAVEDVYAALEAPQLPKGYAPDDIGQVSFASAGELLEHISRLGNDLQQPAMKLAPMISDVLVALSHQQGCQAAQMSGSGPTCFGVFENAGHASRARERLRTAHPDWWVVSTRLEHDSI